jgi:hypothetical protein
MSISIAGGHDAEGTDGRQRADLRAAKRHVAVARPDALAFYAARQLEVACEHVARIERLALAWIGQPPATALVEFATVDIALARVVNRPRVEVHKDLLERSARDNAKGMAVRRRLQP